MPGLVLALVAVFPSSNVGLELAAIVMIFTGQAWNMTFSFYHSVSSVPADLGEAATVYRFTAWQRFRWVEAALLHDRARLEQHDEHGWRLVLPHGHARRSGWATRISACRASAPT